MSEEEVLINEVWTIIKKTFDDLDIHLMAVFTYLKNPFRNAQFM